MPVLRRCACGGSRDAGGECSACSERRLQRMGAGAAPGIAPPVVHDVLRSPGAPLTAPVRTEIERRLGHDFSSVRVHTDDRAAASAAALQAEAYTVRSDVVFGADRYRPGTSAGQELLAHELVHVAQQRGAPATGSPIGVADPDGPAEREAKQASVGGAGPVTSAAVAAPGLVHRQPAAPPLPPWSLSDVRIEVFDPQDWVNGNGEARATLGVTRRFPFRYELCGCDADKGHFCPPEEFGLLLSMFLDDERAAQRPQPVRPPFVSLTMVYRPDKGSPTVVHEEPPALAQYTGHGEPISLPFPSLIPYTVDEPGSLLVAVNLADRDVEEISFVDSIRFDSFQCPPKQPDVIRPRPRRVKKGGK
jgi:hypothetical protein